MTHGQLSLLPTVHPHICWSELSWSDRLEVSDWSAVQKLCWRKLYTVQRGVTVLHKGPDYLVPVRAAILTSIVCQQSLCCLHPSLSSQVAVCVVCGADFVMDGAPGLQEVHKSCGDKLVSFIRRNVFSHAKCRKILFHYFD